MVVARLGQIDEAAEERDVLSRLLPEIGDDPLDSKVSVTVQMA